MTEEDDKNFRGMCLSKLKWSGEVAWERFAEESVKEAEAEFISCV